MRDCNQKNPGIPKTYCSHKRLSAVYDMFYHIFGTGQPTTFEVLCRLLQPQTNLHEFLTQAHILWGGTHFQQHLILQWSKPSTCRVSMMGWAHAQMIKLFQWSKYGMRWFPSNFNDQNSISLKLKMCWWADGETCRILLSMAASRNVHIP